MATETVTNSGLFLWSLYELGGADDFVDVEDVFFRAFELAPRRLSWRTRDDIPDYKKCSKGLRDAESKTPKLLVKNGSDERRLSMDGQQWIEQNFDRLAEALDPAKVVREPRQRRSSRLISAAKLSPVFETWMDGGALPEEKWPIADLLSCSPDSTQRVWRRGLEEMKSAAYAADEKELLDFLAQLEEKKQELF